MRGFKLAFLAVLLSHHAFAESPPAKEKLAALVDPLTAADINASIKKSGASGPQANLFFYSKINEETGSLWWKVPRHERTPSTEAMDRVESACLVQQVKEAKAVNWKSLGLDLSKVRVDLVSYRNAIINGQLWRGEVQVKVPEDVKAAPSIIITAYSHSGRRVWGEKCNSVDAKEIEKGINKAYETLVAKGLSSGKIPQNEKRKMLEQIEEPATGGGATTGE